MTGPHPDVAAARSAVRAALADVPAGALVLVACSGGPDSIALAAATAFVAPRIGLRAGAVSIDHRLQPGSARTADDAVATCARLGLAPSWAVRVDVVGPGGLEAAARAARYAALEDAAKRVGAVVVLLGHTLDDQAETVLLGLAGGSGARSLAGMSARRGLIRRPLLGLRRVQTEAVCAALELPVWTDPMNAAVHAHRRAAVRLEAMPALEHALGPGVTPALARTAAMLREDADLLDDLAARLLEDATVPDDDDGGVGPDDGGPARQVGASPATSRVLDVARLVAAPPALRGRALRAAAIAVGARPGDLAHRHVEAMGALVTAWHGQGPVDLPGGVVVTRACGRLALRSNSARK